MKCYMRCAELLRERKQKTLNNSRWYWTDSCAHSQVVPFKHRPQRTHAHVHAQTTHRLTHTHLHSHTHIRWTQDGIPGFKFYLPLYRDCTQLNFISNFIVSQEMNEASKLQQEVNLREDGTRFYCNTEAKWKKVLQDSIIRHIQLWHFYFFTHGQSDL